MPRRWFMVSGPAHARTVCLTFDDGPDPGWTPRVLDALRAARARGTFFVQGSKAAACPDLVKRIHAEGHDIGHHSWTHGHPSKTSAAELEAEIVRTRAWLKTMIGIDSTLFRPPHGKMSAAKMVGAWTLSQTIVLWNADPGDLHQPSGDALLAWVDEHPAQAGDIVLLHDRAPALVETLPALIDRIRARGLGLARISEWLP
jgi:peptidoglycan-N-acetylglucosamine deacetylase